MLADLPSAGAASIHQGDVLALHYRGEVRSLFALAHQPASRHAEWDEHGAGVATFARQAFRLDLWGQATSFFSFEAVYELELDTPAPRGETFPTLFQPPRRPATFLGLDWTPHATETFVWRHRFDRLNATLRLPWLHGVRLTIGRLAETWGYGTLFRPADRLHPPRAVEMVRRHMPGVDAVRLAIALAPAMELRALFLPAERVEDIFAALRFEMTVGCVDLAATIGDDRHRVLAGLGARAGLGKVQLSGEALYLHDPDAAIRDHAEAVVGVSADLPLGLMGTLEFSYDGSGAGGVGGYPARWSGADWSTARRVGVGRYYGGVSLEARPLQRLVIAGRSIVNLADRSALFAAYVRVGLSDGAWIQMTAAVPIGAAGEGTPGSEFGITPYLYGIDITLNF